jgi:hypothetical protein
MPTYSPRPRFLREHSRLSEEEKAALKRAVRQFVSDLRAGTGRFHPSLRVHRIDGRRRVWSLSFGADLHATFSYGPPQESGDAHIIWRRVGGHAIYREP